MDPISALSVASAAFSIVTFGKDLIKGGILIHDSIQNDHVGSRSRESVVNEMHRLSSALIPPNGDSIKQEDQVLRALASNCRKLSSELIKLVTELKPKDPESKLQNIRAAIKTKAHGKTLQDLEDRLNSCRSQLHLELTHRTSKQTNTLLETLIEASHRENEKLWKILDEIQQNRVRISSLDPQAQDEFGQLIRAQLISLQQDALDTIKQARVVKGLYFEEIHRRYEEVAEAHARTFTWMTERPRAIVPGRPAMPIERETKYPHGDKGAGGHVEDISNGSDSADEIPVSPITSEGKHSSANYNGLETLRLRQDAKRLLWDWVASTGGIIHISGKLGSGKSTLMKLLVDSKNLQAGLKEWAGDQTLVFAAFFFWRPGTRLQKSLPGLLRSLLYDILKSRPSLTPEIMPEAWERASNASWLDQSHLIISEKEIQLGFDRLLQSEAARRDCRFCFFIDGLDEYEQTPQFDHRRMVEMLNEWHSRAPASIKACVSSREENVFMNNFNANRRLRLPEITRPDMQTYVGEMLSHFPRKEKAELVERITSRADGIFLWVTLVTRDVRMQHENKAGLEDLLGRVDSWHRELSDLFGQLLASIHPMDRKRAYQIFAITRLVNSRPSRRHAVTPESLLFLEQYSNKPEFSFHSNPTGTSHHLLRADADKRLNGWCRGLVESKPYLHFTHRSVPEFLEQPRIREEMERELQGFDAIAAASYISIYASGWDPVPLDVAMSVATIC